MPENPSARARVASCARTAPRSRAAAGVGLGIYARQYNGPMSQARGLYSVAQVRAFDERAIHELGVAGYNLMDRAGAAAVRVLRERLAGQPSLWICLRDSRAMAVRPWARR